MVKRKLKGSNVKRLKHDTKKRIEKTINRMDKKRKEYIEA